MPRRQLGPWGKLYASLEEDTAHYTAEQLRAFIGILCRAIKNRGGELPKRRPLSAIYGKETVDFLFDEGRLEDCDGRVCIVDWPIYQAPKDPTNAKRQADWRARRPQVDNGVDNASNAVTVTDLPRATSTTVTTSRSGNGVVAPARETEPETEAISLLASWGAAVPPDGNGIHRALIDLVRRRGIIDVTVALRSAHDADPKASGRQLVFSAANTLDVPLSAATKKPVTEYRQTMKEIEHAIE